MSPHDAVAAVPVAGTPDRGLLQALLITRFVYVFMTGENPQTVSLSNDGATTLGVAFNGLLFWYDSTDATTAHDGITCVVDADGKRYKVEAVNSLIRSILDKDLTAPPGSPAFGDAYIVGASATGAWATHDDDIAVYTARGWVFAAPVAGWLVYAVDEDAHYKFTSGGAWAIAFSNPASTIAASSLIGSRTHWVVVNQTTNTPPTVGQGIAYIVGPSPTGAWAGQSNKIAVREAAGSGSTFVIYAPAEGWTAYDQASNVTYYYDGAAWQSLSGAFVDMASVETASGTQSAAGGGTIYAYSATTPPATSNQFSTDNATIAYAARASGKKLYFEYDATIDFVTGVSGPGTAPPSIGLLRDSDVNAVDWCLASFTPIQLLVGVGTTYRLHVHVSFVVTSADATSHTYKIAGFTGQSSSSNNVTLGNYQRRNFSVKEAA